MAIDLAPTYLKDHPDLPDKLSPKLPMGIIKALPILIIFIFLGSCIDPYTPEIRAYKDLLVVDALITDKNESYQVRLSQSMENTNSEPEMVTGAMVSVLDTLGNEYLFSEEKDGIYTSNPDEFTAQTGNSYSLRIITAEGQHYESDFEKMIPVPEIDSVYYHIQDEIISSEQKEYKGLEFYIDTKDETGKCRYYRWDFVEDWEFAVPFPQMADYDDNRELNYIPIENHHCWKNERSSEIKLLATADDPHREIIGYPVGFRTPERSDRFNIAYSIQVRQYSMSERQYNFWQDMQSVNEETDDIFQRQPVSLRTNIENISDPGEKVIGFFQVSAVSEKRIFINSNDLKDKGLKFWKHNCELFIYPDDVEQRFPNAYQAYIYFTPQNFLHTFKIVMGGVKLYFTPRKCADCSTNGQTSPPVFWDNYFNQ